MEHKHKITIVQKYIFLSKPNSFHGLPKPCLSWGKCITHLCLSTKPCLSSMRPNTKDYSID